MARSWGNVVGKIGCKVELKEILIAIAIYIYPCMQVWQKYYWALVSIYPPSCRKGHLNCIRLR